MDIQNDTPMRDATIQDTVVQVPAPYKAGHEVNDNEANALNQVVVENVRNNLAGKFKKAKEEEGGLADQAAQKIVDDYVLEYEIGVRRGRTAILDPVERETHKLADELVRGKLKSMGKKLADIEDDQMEVYITTAIEKNPIIREQAQKIVDAREATRASLEIE